MSARDRLFLLPSAFEAPAAGPGLFHCPSCARMTGVLAYDPQVRERKILVDLPAHTPGGPTEPAIRMPILFDGHAALPEGSAPKLGEHDAEIAADPDWNAKQPG